MIPTKRKRRVNPGEKGEGKNLETRREVGGGHGRRGTGGAWSSLRECEDLGHERNKGGLTKNWPGKGWAESRDGNHEEKKKGYWTLGCKVGTSYREVGNAGERNTKGKDELNF